MLHRLSLDPKTHVVSCRCGATESGLGALDRAELHRTRSNAHGFKRAQRLGLLTTWTTTQEFARGASISRSAAHAYLTRLRRIGRIWSTWRQPSRRLTWRDREP